MIIFNHRRNKRIKRREAETQNKLRMMVVWLKLKEDNQMDQLNRISKS